MLLACEIHNFCCRKLATFTTKWMDISSLFRPDLYLCDLSRIQMAVIFHILGRHTIIHWSAIPLIIKCICSPVMWSLSIARLTLTLFKLVTLGRDECHGFVIKCRRIHYKRLRDLLWMSSEGINMWGNEGFGLIFQFWPFVRLIGSSWSRYSTTIQYSVWLIGWLDDPLDHSSYCCHLSLQYRVSVHSNCSFKTDNKWARC